MCLTLSHLVSCLSYSKYPNNPDATCAFQKVAVAYDVLSKPSSRRLYDSRSSSVNFDVFAARPPNHADETFRGVIVGVFNDFLDGDLEVIRNLLSTIDCSLHCFVTQGTSTHRSNQRHKPFDQIGRRWYQLCSFNP